MRFHAILFAIVLLACVAPPTSVAEDAPAFVITLTGDAVNVTGAGLTLVASNASGHHFRTNFSVTSRGVVNATAGNVTRPHDLTVMLDGALVPEVASSALGSAAPPGMNDSRADGTLADLVLPSGEHSLVILVDHEPPRPTLVGISAVTHNSAIVTTRTDEPTLGVLVLHSAARTVRFSTPNPAFEQSFPLSGLEADMDHDLQLTFRDRAGNEASLGPFTFRTLPVPPRPPPTLALLEPKDGARLDAPITRIVATATDMNSTLLTLTFIVDKAPVDPVPRDATGRIDYVPPAPLGPGVHTLTIEATNALGGNATLRAKFMVEPHATPNIGVAAAAAVLCLAAMGVRRHRRG